MATQAIKKIKIGITHGDINGISYEIILKAFRDSRMLEFFTPVIYGSPKVAAYYKKVLKLSTVNLNHIKDATQADPDTVNIINCVSNKIRVEIGKATEMAGEAAVDALKAAVADLKQGKIDCLVTAPINKKTVQSEEFNFKGHTWYLANEFGAEDVLMLMVHDDLRVAVATDHIAIKDVAGALSVDLIVSKLKLIDKSLKNDFAKDRPLIAVLGLNPHAGDDGLIGDEEEKIIIPAIEKAKEEGLMVMGPYAADGFFASENYKNFDAILAMYHDQGLIPFKTLSLGKGVNYTAGLPIVRTSPDHGTAYNIAGLNKADADSFVNAMFLARKILFNRQLFQGIEPLQKQNMEELISTLQPVHSQEIQEMNEVQDAEDEIVVQNEAAQVDVVKKELQQTKTEPKITEEKPQAVTNNLTDKEAEQNKNVQDEVENIKIEETVVQEIAEEVIVEEVEVVSDDDIDEQTVDNPKKYDNGKNFDPEYSDFT